MIEIVYDEKTFSYSFKNHPFSSEKAKRAAKMILEENIAQPIKPRDFGEDILYIFHTKEYVEFVKTMSQVGSGYLDYGDTPAYKNVHEDALWLVYSTLTAIENSLEKNNLSINLNGGLHHAYSDHASGFCVYNDAAIGIKFLLNKNVKPILYVDIDAHHGDGVFYSFYKDPHVFIIDFHEDPRTLFPGTGFENERGEGIAEGTKLNIVMKAYSDHLPYEKIEEFAELAKPEFVIMQAGADGLKNDPLTHLMYPIEDYVNAVYLTYKIAKKFSHGRMVMLGGGGYDADNASKAYYLAVKKIKEEMT